MTVRDMIALLETYSGDLRVVVSGYEEGFDDLSPGQIFVRRIALNTGVNDWEGDHRDADEPASSGQSATICDALALHRTSH